MDATNIPKMQCGFEELGLQVGDCLQLQIRGSDAQPRSYITNLIGHIASSSVLVRTPLTQGFPLSVGAGDALEVKFFSGLYHCTFDTLVLRRCRTPVHYLHLVYPERVQRVVFRSALRVRVNLPGMAAAKSDGAHTHPVPISVTDLSISGAQVDSNRELGCTGDAIDVAFKFFVQPNDYLVNFETKAIIQSSKDAAAASANGVRYGLRFGAMRATDGVLLQSYLQQIILEDRSRSS